ncbi:undecaprenyldiphospho-muramoylpentapeptide beta-N-acetylglucosaminyltransferase [Sphingobacteriales bacterium UPWRP_1]|nr:undecaprenyldiphospho-muramoylpentapeptide beta-N-acetylglucosaminyltransferase [Sphingobacteriales bacterium TSM_CSM]PSJ78197.1 undecaprenyldiphospho-muramoylpentapeptide beta-N-acetylglucosaminyltransferase [Sphingobacteriales bacterium UPWRP_1]
MSQITPKIIISGGGTGGHVFPAIAIANALKELAPGAEILFVGAKGRIEMEKVPQAGYNIEALWISGLQRRLTTENLLFPVKVISSLWKSYRILRRFKPDVAVGVGGYASWAVLQAASGMGIPTLIQEQNSHPGITNRLLGKKASKICVVYDNLYRYFDPQKIVLTGNPVRADIAHLQGSKEEALRHFGLQEGKKTLFITGGSLGARGINDGLLACLPQLMKDNNVQLLWQAGKFYIDQITKEVNAYGNAIVPLAFIDRMDLAYIAADAILSRAGGTVSELCLVGKPVVLMPSPNVAEDHQTANALNLTEKDAAIMVRDAEAAQKLLPALQTVLFNEERRQTLANNLKKMAKPDAALQIAREVLALIPNKGNLKPA